MWQLSASFWRRNKSARTTDAWMKLTCCGSWISIALYQYISGNSVQNHSDPQIAMYVSQKPSGVVKHPLQNLQCLKGKTRYDVLCVSFVSPLFLVSLFFFISLSLSLTPSLSLSLSVSVSLCVVISCQDSGSTFDSFWMFLGTSHVSIAACSHSTLKVELL